MKPEELNYIHTGPYLNHVDEIVSNVYQYLSQIEYSQPEGDRQFLADTNYDIDVVGFMIQERNEMITNHFHMAAQELQELCTRYIEAVLSCKFIYEPSFYYPIDAWHHYEDMIKEYGSSGIFLGGPIESDQIQDLNNVESWYVKELSSLRSNELFHTVEKVHDAPNRLIHSFTYHVINSSSYVLDHIRNVTHPYEAYLYFKRMVRITIFTIYILGKISVDA